MIKIELVRFEAQDVITASGVAKPSKPNKPQKPVVPPVQILPTEPAPTEGGSDCTCDALACDEAHRLNDTLHYGCSASSHNCGY